MHLPTAVCWSHGTWVAHDVDVPHVGPCRYEDEPRCTGHKWKQDNDDRKETQSLARICTLKLYQETLNMGVPHASIPQDVVEEHRE